MRAVGRIILWLLTGLLGSALIVFIATLIVDYRSLPKMGIGGSVFTSFWDNGYVTARGTWVLEDSKQAFPRQTTEIKCFRDQKECLSAQAEITYGDTLYVQTERFSIATWDANTIVYTSSDPSCVVYVYTISRASERATGQRRPKQSSSALCKEMLEQRVLNLTLRDGFKVWQELNQEVISSTFPYMWVGLGVWWAFIVFRIFRRRRMPQLQGDM